MVAPVTVTETDLRILLGIVASGREDLPQHGLPPSLLADLLSNHGETRSLVCTDRDGFIAGQQALTGHDAAAARPLPRCAASPHPAGAFVDGGDWNPGSPGALLAGFQDFLPSHSACTRTLFITWSNGPRA